MSPAEGAFFPRSVRHAGEILLDGRLDEVFTLFSPLGERLWVPDWNPEILYPPDRSWRQGALFRTMEKTGEAIWIVTRHDRHRSQVEYHRVEPGWWVARVEVSCTSASAHLTRAKVIYEFVGLSEQGNAEIRTMSAEAYAQKMARWTEWINHHLAQKKS